MRGQRHVLHAAVGSLQEGFQWLWANQQLSAAEHHSPGRSLAPRMYPPPTSSGVMCAAAFWKSKLKTSTGSARGTHLSLQMQGWLGDAGLCVWLGKRGQRANAQAAASTESAYDRRLASCTPSTPACAPAPPQLHAFVVWPPAPAVGLAGVPAQHVAHAQLPGGGRVGEDGVKCRRCDNPQGGCTGMPHRLQQALRGSLLDVRGRGQDVW